MKRNLIALFCILLSCMSWSQELSMMTYNIRYATVNDQENQWEKRKGFLTEQIGFYEPDVFGVQEGLHSQLEFIDQALPGYNYIGVGRDDGKEKGEYCAIFFNKEKLELLDQGTFWLSSTPDKVSKGWDAAFERICTYARFKDRASDMVFLVFNTHFDHIGELAREKSAELIVKKASEINKDNFPVVLMGDLNLNEKSKAIKYLSAAYNDSKMVSEAKPFGPHGTFTGFQFHDPVKDRIDYIFCSKENISVKKYAVLTDSKESRYPSDHFPVMIKIIMNLSTIDK